MTPFYDRISNVARFNTVRLSPGLAHSFFVSHLRGLLPLFFHLVSPDGVCDCVTVGTLDADLIRPGSNFKYLHVCIFLYIEI